MDSLTDENDQFLWKPIKPVESSFVDSSKSIVEFENFEVKILKN
jgi:hypothetical protein